MRVTWVSRVRQLLLAVSTMLVLLGGVPAVAQEGDPPSGDYVFGDALAPEDGEFPVGDEVVEARTETTRTYETEIPGVFSTEVSATPVNFQQNGDWVPIDASLVESEGGFENAANSVQIDVADSADAETVAELTLPSSASVGFGIDDAEASEVAVDGDTATYEDAVEGADVELQSLPTGLKETIVLDSAASPTVYSFPLSVSGVTPQLDESGGVAFVDGNNHVKFVIPPGYMEDSSVDAVGNPAASDAVAYALVDGGQTLEVSVDGEWLTDPARQFPVMVDPTVYVYSDADDTFVASVGSTDRSGYYVLKAGYDGTYKYRSFLHFDMSQFDDMNLLAATLRLAQTGSGSCTASPLDVYQVTESWSGSTTTSWPGPDVSDEVLGTISSGAGHDGSCGWAFATTDMTRLAQHWSEGQDNFGISLRARDENATSQWKEVGSQESYNAPRIEVLWGDPTETSAPDNPTDLLPVDEETTDSTPTFSGTYSDPQNDDGEIVFFGYDGTTGAFLSGYPSSVVDSGNTATYTSSELPIDYNVIWRALAVDTVHGVGSELSDLNQIRRPSVYVTGPSDESTQTSNFTVSASLDGGVSGATGVQFLLDGSPVATDNSAPYSTTVNISGLGVESHDLTAKIVGGAWAGATSSEVTIDTDDGSPDTGGEDEYRLFIDSGGIVVGPADAENSTDAIAQMAAELDPEVDPEDLAIAKEAGDADHPEDMPALLWTPDSSTVVLDEDEETPLAPTYSGSLTGTEQTNAAALFIDSPGSGPFILESSEFGDPSNDPCTTEVLPPTYHNDNDPNKVKAGTQVQCTSIMDRTSAFSKLYRIRSDYVPLKKDNRGSRLVGTYAEIRTNEGCDSSNSSLWRAKGHGEWRYAVDHGWQRGHTITTLNYRHPCFG